MESSSLYDALFTAIDATRFPPLPSPSNRTTPRSEFNREIIFNSVLSVRLSSTTLDIFYALSRILRIPFLTLSFFLSLLFVYTLGLLVSIPRPRFFRVHALSMKHSKVERERERKLVSKILDKTARILVSIRNHRCRRHYEPPPPDKTILGPERLAEQPQRIVWCAQRREHHLYTRRVKTFGFERIDRKGREKKRVRNGRGGRERRRKKEKRKKIHVHSAVIVSLSFVSTPG